MRSTAAAAPVLTYEEICTIASQGKDQEAIAALERFVEAESRGMAAPITISACCTTVPGRQRKLWKNTARRSECEPRDIIYRKNLADLTYIELRDPETALRHYVEILTISPRDAETLLALAQVCVDLQKDNDALVFLDTLLGNEPWNTQAREMRSAVQVRQTLPGGGSSGMNPLDAVGAALASGRTDEAIRFLEQHVRTNPQDAAARNDLGVLYYQSGRVAEAGAQYEEAVRLDPGNDIFAQNLADFYVVEAGRPEDALRIYVRILEKKPRDVDTLLGIGRICEVLGRAAGCSRTSIARRLMRSRGTPRPAIN